MRRAVYALIAIAIVALAGGFPAYLAMGQGGSNIAAITVTATPSFVTSPGGGGDGGWPVPNEGQGCPEGEVSASSSITNEGLVTTPIMVKSSDELFELTIDQGTVALTHAGLCLGCIGIHKAGLPSPPEGVYVIGVMYGVAPKGATFSPPAIIAYRYDPAALPEGVAEDRLVIACHDETSDKWINLDSVVDTEAKTITARISRFYDLAVFGYGVEAPPPAAFQISQLSISPSKVEIGEAVNITILVANTGGQPGIYQAILKIDGVAETAQDMILNAGASTKVSFTISKKASGSYSVDVNGLTGTFEVKEKPVVPTPAPFNWWLIVLAVAAAALAALLTYVFREKIEASGITGTLSAGLGKVTSLFSKLIKRG